jgi:putative ABC transport system permease protein
MIFTRFGIIRSRAEFFDALKRKELTDDDVEAVRRLVPQAKRVTGRAFSQHPVYAEGRRLADIFVLGSGPEMPWMIGLELEDGRYFTQTEADAARPVAVIGWDLKDELFPQVDAVGRMINVEGKPFRVIGTMARQGSSFGQSQDRFVLVPLESFRHAFGITRGIDMFVEAPDEASRKDVEDAVRGVLRARRGTSFGAPDPFGIVDAEALNTLWNSITYSAFALVIWISSISLVVGGVAIANTMFASVVERTHEIGVRKALGARKQDILWQFLTEAMTLTGVGGVLGVLVGGVVAAVVNALSPFPAVLQPLWVILGFATSVVTGLVFGLWPALKAARLDPITALRYE